MSTLSQASLFSWKEVEAAPEMLRLRRVLAALPDGELIAALEVARRGRRDDYPVRAMWHAFVAGVVFGHASGASLRRELARNGELWEACGFDPIRRTRGISKSAWSRFVARLLAHEARLEAIFEATVATLVELLPDFGRHLAADGKAISTYRRGDPEASVGYKNYEGEDDRGEPLQQIQRWLGYKLHLVIDAKYELPVAWEVSGAAVGESPRLLPLVEHLAEQQPKLYARTATLAADRGYDDGEDKATLHEAHGIAPVIPARDLHGGVAQPLDPQRHDTIYLSPTGAVMCKVDPFAAEPDKVFTPMAFMGYEADRQSLKFRCPAAAHGVACKNREACRCAPAVRDGAHGRVVRVALERDRRRLLPIHQHSHTFKRLYKRRTAIERVNSRIDQVYGLERHFLHGLARVRLRLLLTMIVMNTTAIGWTREARPELIRSLLRAA
jgi:hypothetical protein